MEQRLIVRGVLAGALGGLGAFVFARIFAEPVIGRAVAFEDARNQAAHEPGVHDHGAELFSRGVQANIGMGFGVLAFGVAIGALLAVAFVMAHGRIGSVRPQAFALLIAAAGFAAAYVVPMVKYPPNPPAVGLAETVRERTGWYLLMVGLSIALAIGVVWLGHRLTQQLGSWNATLVGAGAYLAGIAVAMWLLPAVDETPQGFPADDLYAFRLAALGTQLVLWTTIAVVFARLAGRLLDRTPSARVLRRTERAYTGLSAVG
jgi:predicted cobalt transporter CbtA